MTTANRRRKSSAAKTARDILYFLAIAVAVVISFWNLQPYIRVSQYTLTSVLAANGGVIEGRFFNLLGWGIGFVLWAFLQTCEAYPVVLRHDRRLMRILAQEAENCDQLPVREEDDPALAQLKGWYNNFPLLGIRGASRASLAAYGLDAVICLITFPPVSGGMGRLLFVLITGQWSAINWANVGLILCMMFVFEIMVRLVLYLGLQTQYFRQAHNLK